MKNPVKMMMKLITCLGFVMLAGVCFASSDLSSGAVKMELEDAISKIVPKDRFLVQVTMNTDTVSEKRISEGETVTQNNPSNEVNVPPLPGFTVPPTTPQSPVGQSRQSYKMVDKEVLKSVNVAVDLDQSVDNEAVDQVKALVTRYLDMSYGKKASVTFSNVHMIAAAPSSGNSAFQDFFAKNWAGLIIGLLVVTLSIALLKMFFSKKREPLYPRVMNRADEEEADVSYPKYGRDHDHDQNGKPKPSALPSGSFPSLPATTKFIDGRTELLKEFLKNSETFRLYFSKLSEAAQMELYTGLRGPAFDSLLETLSLKVPVGNENTPPPSEEQMLFYQKNFQEFIDTHLWQHSQFFGFLRQLTADQLSTLIKQENPVVSAVILKFCKPEDSALVLGSLSSKVRMEILDQFYRTQNLSSDELSQVETAVREKVSRLPKLLLGYNQQDQDYWSKVLTHSTQQEALLLDLEKSRPDLYPALAKFRFKLEDMPSLPTPLVQKVLDEIDNEELSLALLKCPKPVVDFALAELGTERRALIASHLGMYSGIPNEKIQQARQSLTLKFREVIA